MTPEAQRIAIAEACGWERIDFYGQTLALWCFNGGKGRSEEELPDYLNDLNAMHEAEEVLEYSDRIKARWMLVQLSSGWRNWRPHEYEALDCWEMSLHSIDECLRATAAQRAEAFLRTIGKWEDDK